MPDETPNGCGNGRDLTTVVFPTRGSSIPTIYRLEQESLFRRGWMLAGVEGQIPENGSVMETEVAGFPLIFTRDGKGEVRAFQNVCPHRNANTDRKAGPIDHGEQFAAGGESARLRRINLDETQLSFARTGGIVRIRGAVPPVLLTRRRRSCLHLRSAPPARSPIFPGTRPDL
ncbi:MAG: Rieske 2Fe-2S domain-containing protein [Rhodospirillales bacterium]|nr:Rieske 2Fe-2S domain-containing protein [Rhodospirillales bacterium]